MKTACFIPIKQRSERVPDKNFRVLNGRKLYEYIIEHVMDAGCFDDIYVDTNSNEVAQYIKKCGLGYIERKPHLAENSANGNDLLAYHFDQFPDYDFYFQAFATAPYLQPKSIRNCVNSLLNSSVYDSCFTAVKHCGFFWFNNIPFNYRPGILPRTQDMTPVIEETTGLYGVSKSALSKYRCRIGRNPLVYPVSKFEAVDINSDEDLVLAEYIGSQYWKYGSNSQNI
jgi:N-acylneuraminate cytidylyltransferase